MHGVIRSYSALQAALLRNDKILSKMRIKADKIYADQEALVN
jgi:hypothetical protein